MTDIEMSLRVLAKEYVSLADIGRAVAPDLHYVSWYGRIHALPKEMSPEAHGGFRVPGMTVFNIDAGVAYAEKFAAYWAERQAARTAKK